MSRAVVVEPGAGLPVGNVEFLCLSEDSPRFNAAVITMAPRRHGPGAHKHAEEDDAFYILEGEMSFAVEGEEVTAGPGTFVLVPPGVEHGFRNAEAVPVRMLNIHAPAGFDRRIGLRD